MTSSTALGKGVLISDCGHTHDRELNETGRVKQVPGCQTVAVPFLWLPEDSIIVLDLPSPPTGDRVSRLFLDLSPSPPDLGTYWQAGLYTVGWTVA